MRLLVTLLLLLLAPAATGAAARPRRGASSASARAREARSLLTNDAFLLLACLQIRIYGPSSLLGAYSRLAWSAAC